MNESELRNLLYTAQLDTNQVPFVIRYQGAKGHAGMEDSMQESHREGPQNKRRRRHRPSSAWGIPGNFVTAAIRELKTEGLNPAITDMRLPNPWTRAAAGDI